MDAQVQILRWVCLAMAASSFLLGGWMLIEPTAFWELAGVPEFRGGAAYLVVAVLYAGAIVGEGSALLLVWLRPIQYLGFLHYMMIYKGVSCAALAVWLLGDDSASPRLWLVILAWASAGLIAAFIYPWGRWAELAGRPADSGENA